MNNIKVLASIITPCYNAERTIKQTIESVLSQTYPYWEMLVVDDCSTDESAKIIKEYTAKNPRVKYYKTEKISGSPSLPRNIGIEHAQGRFIAFLDSDDIWLPNKLKEQIGLFEQANVAIVFSNYEKINEDGDRHSRYIIAPSQISYQQLLKGNVIGCLTAIYDTSKVGKNYLKKIGHEDYVLWLSMLKKGYIAKNTNSVTALYRVREQSISSNKLKVLSWQWDIYRQEENLSYIKAIYYFIHYAIGAFKKAIK